MKLEFCAAPTNLTAHQLAYRRGEHVAMQVHAGLGGGGCLVPEAVAATG